MPIDTGFIVHNERTYPNLLRLFGELGVATQPTEMSMSVHCDGCGLEYAGGRARVRLFAQARRRRIPASCGCSPRSRASTAQARSCPRLRRRPAHLGRLPRTRGFSPYFANHFAVPVVSCVWSAGSADAALYPARYLFRFLDNHGMLSVTGSPQWRTVTGGSRTYVERCRQGLSGVQTWRRHPRGTRHADGVELIDDDGQTARLDAVVVATHPDTALRPAGDPTDDERRCSARSATPRNETLLHTDAVVLPAARRARASWNYRMRRLAPGEPDRCWSATG